MRACLRSSVFATEVVRKIGISWRNLACWELLLRRKACRGSFFDHATYLGAVRIWNQKTDTETARNCVEGWNSGTKQLKASRKEWFCRFSNHATYLGAVRVWNKKTDTETARNREEGWNSGTKQLKACRKEWFCRFANHATYLGAVGVWNQKNRRWNS